MTQMTSTFRICCLNVGVECSYRAGSYDGIRQVEEEGLALFTRILHNFT